MERRRLLWPWLATGVQGIACLLLLLLFTAAQAHAAENTPVAVRLSYVKGTVRVLNGDRTQFPEAVANMPLPEGYQVETGGDGEAEIEFDDGSVARLTPNSSLQLSRLHPANARSPHTEVEQRSGLAYFELNVSEGQRYAVRFAGATARPLDNSIFRINLDGAPELAVFEGAVHVDGGGAFSEDVARHQSIRLEQGANAGQYTLSDGINADSWDQWNNDRDQEIAAMSQEQTDAREQSGSPDAAGWNDLDAYGNWYPVEGYGNVWAPAGVGPQWDPYGNGYWANYPGWGYTWISGYPWGWLPYQCGAWNYFNTFGWGWIPGQCGLGWSPVLTVWNVPPGYHPPPRPIPGGHIGGGPSGHLVPVNRGTASRGPLEVQGWRGVRPLHAAPAQLDGQTVLPLPRKPVPVLNSGNGRAMLPSTGERVGPVHVGVPVHPNPQPSMNRGSEVMLPPPGVRPPTGVRPPGPIYGRPPSIAPRPMNIPQFAPPRITAPPPRAPAPAPAPMPRMSAPAPAPRPR